MIIKQIILLKVIMFYLIYFCKGQDDEEIKAISKNESISRVRGSRSEVGEVSYSVIFYEKKRYLVNTNMYPAPICSGSVLSTRWVLITATPLGYYSLKTVFMSAGTMEEYVTAINLEAQYNIDKIIIHPEWHEHEHNNLGLARSTKMITFGIGLGTIRIPLDFKFASNNEVIMCKMSIWATHAGNHMMGRLQASVLSKQNIHFKVSNERQMCPNYFVPNKTLCLLQFNESRIDVCSVNVGSAITCGFGMVAIFTGENNYEGCVDRPPLAYSAVNLYGYIDWIQEIVDHSILLDEKTFHTISCSQLISFNFRLLTLGQLLLYLML